MPDEENLNGKPQRTPGKRQRMKKLINEADNLAGTEQKMVGDNLGQISNHDDEPMSDKEVKPIDVQPELMDQQ